MRIPLIFQWPGTVAQGRRPDEPVSILDILPTVLSLAGIGPPDGTSFAGRDLSSLLQAPVGGVDGGLTDGRLIFGESGSALLPQNPRRAIGGTLLEAEVIERYIRDDNWVIVRWRQGGAVTLHDRRSDPALRIDVSRSHPQILKKMTTRLDVSTIFEGRWRSVRDARWKLIRAPEARGIRWELYDLDADPHEKVDLASGEPEQVERLRDGMERWMRSLPEVATAGTVRTDEERREVEERLRSLGYLD